MNLLFLAITLSEVPVRTLRMLSTLRLRASLLPRTSTKIIIFTVVDLLSLRTTLSAVALRGRRTIEYASLCCSLLPRISSKIAKSNETVLPRTPSQLTSSRRSLRASLLPRFLSRIVKYRKSGGLSQLNLSRKSLRGGEGFFGFRSVMLRGMQ